VNSLISALINEHRAIEAGLEPLSAAITARQIDGALFRQLAALTARHYSHEEQFLQALQPHDPGLAAKLRAQHAEALEIAVRLDESLAAGEARDVIYLARRFLAVAQHNIIEEERDVFPLAERFLNGEEPAP
jgi:hypothetical protein